MKAILSVTVLACLLSTSVLAEEMIGPVVLADAGDDGSIRRTGAEGQAVYVLAEVLEPGITSPVYAVKGMVRYEGVDGDAHLQLDNYFDGKGPFFTKSLAESGPLKKISGTSDWRPFVLPFFTSQGEQADGTVSPEKLTLSVFLPGEGTVEVREVALYQFADGEDPLQAEGQWVSSQTAILAGAIGGCMIGIWGGIVGVLTARGKARGFVLTSAGIIMLFGILSLILGVVALIVGQPYVVFYPLILAGIVTTIVIGMVRRTLPQRYQAIELKKMQSMDLRTSR